ncbi:MAG: MFS transporter [Acidimicrobiales bacterium]
MSVPRTERFVTMAAARIKGRRLIALLVLCSVFLVDVMGATSVMAAAPSIGRALGLDSAGLQWSLTAAALPAAGMLLVGARLADVLGRRTILLAGLIGTVVSSVACAAAINDATFIAARVALGVSSALAIPAAVALMTDLFTEHDERRRAMAAWSAIGGVGSTTGLLLGGLITAGLGWRWVFLSSAIICLVIALLIPLVAPEPNHRPSPGALDVTGLACFSVGIAAVLYAISKAPSASHSPTPVVAFGVGGAALLAVFTVRQRRIASPLLPPRLLRTPSVRAGNVILFFAGVLVDGLLYTVNLILQDLRGYSALQFGAVAAVMTGVSAVAAGPAQRWIARFGSSPVAVAGLAGLAVTAALLEVSAAPHMPVEELLATMILFGASMGAAATAGFVESVRVSDGHDNAVAGALQSISFTLGTTFGTALVIAVAASVAHLGVRPFADVGHVSLLRGLRTALCAETAVALAGILFVSCSRRPLHRT